MTTDEILRAVRGDALSNRELEWIATAARCTISQREFRHQPWHPDDGPQPPKPMSAADYAARDEATKRENAEAEAAERVPDGARMAHCSLCRQEFPADYLANGVCATCRPRAGWVTDEPQVFEQREASFVDELRKIGKGE